MQFSAQETEQHDVWRKLGFGPITADEKFPRFKHATENPEVLLFWTCIHGTGLALELRIQHRRQNGHASIPVPYPLTEQAARDIEAQLLDVAKVLFR